MRHQDDFKIEDQIKLRMIVLNKTSADDTNTVKLAREIQAKIKDGAAFAEMATVYSARLAAAVRAATGAGLSAPCCARNSPTRPSRSSPARSAT